MSELPKMPKWPKIEPELQGKPFRQQITEWNEVTGAMNRYYANECCYFADDADQLISALRARLKESHQMLSKIQTFGVINGGDWASAVAEVALSAIGDLPKD
jgi:hypothetical protein